MNAEHPFREPPAPAHSGKAVAAMMILGCAVPACLVAGIGLWQDRNYVLLPGPIMVICLSNALLLSIPLFGLPKLRRWAITWYWTLALLQLFLFPVALIACLADVIALLPGGVRETSHVYLWLIFLAVTAPGLWFLLQLVRDPWWQPWRTPR